MKAAEAREQKVAEDKSLLHRAVHREQGRRRPDPREVPQGRARPRLQGGDRQLLRLARHGAGRSSRPRRAPRSTPRGRARCPGPSRDRTRRRPWPRPRRRHRRPTTRRRPMASRLQRRETRAAPGLHLAVDHRLLRLHRGADDRQPGAVVHRLLARGRRHGRRHRELPGAAVRPAGAHLAVQHLHLRRALRAARHGGRPGPGPAAAAGRPGRRLLPHGVLPAGDDARRRRRRRCSCCCSTGSAGLVNQVLGWVGHRGAELDHRPELAQAVAGDRQPVGRRRQRRHLPRGAAQRAAGSCTRPRCSTAPGRCAGSSA